MIIISRWVLPVLATLVSVAAQGQDSTPPNGPAPTPTQSVPHAAHSDAPPDTGGAKANPADPTSPPLADPLKQQAVTDLPPSLATPAVQFIMQAHMDSLAEVKMAQMALKQSCSSKVRQFAKRMVADHESLDSQLDALAGNKGTSAQGVLDSDHASTVQQLAGLSCHDFDVAYVAQMHAAHDRAVALYSAASALNDAQVAKFANRALPMLKMHQRQVKTL